MKIKLVLRPGEFTSFTSYYLEDFWRQYFDISLYDPNLDYNKQRTLFVVWWMNIDNPRDPWPKFMQNQGYKVVVDNLWERPESRTDFYWLEHKYSMRWNESLWWQSLGYDQYRPQKKLEYKALLQLRRSSQIRDTIIAELDQYLNTMLWSHAAQNKRLPNDIDDPDQGQRYMHPYWYDSTYCTVVIETFQSLPIHVSEKSYKPLAYFHPFVSISAPGTLEFLRGAGFETFDNLFDENYDHDCDLARRLDIVKSNLLDIQLIEYDSITQAKIQHNHATFFDTGAIKQAMIKELILPLIDYAEI